MNKAEPPPDLAHLKGLFLALGILLAALYPAIAGMEKLAQAAEEKSVSQPLKQKNQGLALMEAAFRRSDVLPVFGSSELIMDRENRAALFFQNAPTGFRVCPIGEPGNTSLLIAEKIGAMGRHVQGKKMAVMLSFAWFQVPEVSLEEYAGNFSPLHAGVLLINRDIGTPLQHRFAKRMLHYDTTLATHPELAGYLRSLAHQDFWSDCHRLVYWPQLKAADEMLSLEDRSASALALWNSPPVSLAPCPQSQPPVLWDEILGPERRKPPQENYPSHVDLSTLNEASRQFVAKVDASREWQDLELLLDTLKQLGTNPLILCIPFHGVHMDAHGIDPAARARFYHRVERLCAKRGIPCESFLNHDLDPGFTRGDGHPSSKGWLYINQKLDDFYHDRLTEQIIGSN